MELIYLSARALVDFFVDSAKSRNVGSVVLTFLSEVIMFNRHQNKKGCRSGTVPLAVALLLLVTQAALISSASAATCPNYDTYIGSPRGYYQTHYAAKSAGAYYTYYFNLTSGHTYRFTMCEGGGYSGYDTQMWLYNSSCGQVAYNDDYCGAASQFDYYCSSSGTYFLQIGEYGDNAYCDFTIAHRTLSEYCYTCPSYDYDISPNATWYQTHGSVSIGAGGCRMYRAYLYYGTTYTFTFCEGGGTYSGDTYMTLYNSSCGTVASNDDYCGAGSQITYDPSYDGYYYLQINHYAWSSPISYTLAYKGQGSCACPTYDYWITPYSYYNTWSDSFGPGDCDMFAMTLYSGTTYRFTLCEGGGSYSSDTALTLYNSSCGQVGYNDDYCGVGSQLDYACTSTGTYYLKMGDLGDNQATSYTLAYRLFPDTCNTCTSYDYYISPSSSYQTHWRVCWLAVAGRIRCICRERRRTGSRSAREAGRRVRIRH